MKTKYAFFSLLPLLLSSVNCSTNDDREEQPPIIVPENRPPSSVDLLTPVPDGESISVFPDLFWTAATDPDNDPITYEIFLDTNESPGTLVASTQNTDLAIADRLQVLQTYHWKVRATDGKGGSSESNSEAFTTRNLNYFLATPNASFPGRSSAASAVFEDKMWLVGGFQEPTDEKFRTNDVWFTENGIDWNQAVAEASFPGRILHTLTNFQGKLWVIGGFGAGVPLGDIWSSEDGVNWSLITEEAPFGLRRGHEIVVFNNKMWILGGGDATVWSSLDGEEWVVESETGVGNRSRFSSVIFDDKIWAIGGSGPDESYGVMFSEDGVTWLDANSSPPFLNVDGAPFLQRSSHTSVSFDNKIWVFGGAFGFNDVWYSEDGVLWLLAEEEAPFSGRVSHEVQVFKESIWLFAGEEVPGNEKKNDVFFIN